MYTGHRIRNLARLAILLLILAAISIAPTFQALATQRQDKPAPPPVVARVPTMLPPQAPQLDPSAPPPPPSLQHDRKHPAAPVVKHTATQFEPPAPGALNGLVSKGTSLSKGVLGAKSAAPTTDPNLILYKPTGWDDVVVLSTQTGTNRNDTLYEGSPAYLDWAIANEGGDTSTTFTTCVYIDNYATVDTCWTTDGLNLGFYTAIEDWVVNQSPTAGWHLIGVWTDVYNDVAESNEDDNYTSIWFYWYPTGNSLNLTPYVPDGWDYPIMPASEPGTGGNPQLYADTPTYFDISFANYGTQHAGNFATCLYIDDAEQYCHQTALNANFYAYYLDDVVNVSTSGWHTVTLKVDVGNAVTEDNEGDNVWEARFFWEGSSKPNLHAYQPDGWDDALVVSTISHTHTIDKLVGGVPAYVDWAFVNDGWNDIIAPFDIGLYVDGVLTSTWTIPDGLPRGYYVYAEDYSITLPTGDHVLEMRVDTSNAITETSEDDNTHAFESFWNPASGVPKIRVEPSSLSIKLTSQAAAAYTPVTLSRADAPSRPADIQTRGLGAVLTPPTQGVYSPVPLAAQSPENLLASVDLSTGLPPVGNQGSAGSCVGWSSSYYYKTFQEKVDQGWNVTTATHQFAPNFVWNQGQLSATGACEGMYESTALQILSGQGSVPLSSLPYTYDCRQAITLAQKDEAAKYKAQNYGAFFQYGTPPTDAIIDQMKAWLSGGDPILIAIPVLPEFDSPAGAQCIVDLPTQGASRGGHAITIVGYDDNIGGSGTGGFKIVNSWGTGWSCGGFAYLSYRWFKQYAQEAWWMRDIRTGGNAARDFTIFNDGDVSLSVSNVTKQSNSIWLDIVPPAAINPDHPLVIEPGQSATIEINVHGQTLTNGTYNEMLNIASNDSTAPVKTIPVTLEVGVPASSAPPPASNVAPANGAANQPPNRVSVQWQSAGSGTLYDVRMDTSNPPSEIQCNDVSATSCTVGNLKPNTTYYWRTVAADGLNTTLGPVWSFTTGSKSQYWIYLPVLRR
jgi:hypothetical protein